MGLIDAGEVPNTIEDFVNHYMPKIVFSLPTDETIDLVYGAEYPNKGTVYLQGIRSGLVSEDSLPSCEYHGMKTTYAQCLAKDVSVEIATASAVVSLPSSRNDVDPYREEILQKCSANLLEGSFSRKGERKAANGGTVEDMINEFDYRPAGNEADIETIIIVDESIATGKSVAAALFHLREAGLPQDCKVVVAVWGLLSSRGSVSSPVVS